MWFILYRHFITNVALKSISVLSFSRVLSMIWSVYFDWYIVKLILRKLNNCIIHVSIIHDFYGCRVWKRNVPEIKHISTTLYGFFWKHSIKYCGFRNKLSFFNKFSIRFTEQLLFPETCVKHQHIIRWQTNQYILKFPFFSPF